MKNGSTDAIATAAVVVTLATILSRLLGFVREATIAGVYGAGAEVDAHLIAQSVPNVLIALLSTAVVTSMLPTLSADLATVARIVPSRPSTPSAPDHAGTPAGGRCAVARGRHGRWLAGAGIW